MERSNLRRWLIGLSLCLVLLGSTEAKIIYVDDDAVAPGDGSSWQMAYKFLQDALADAETAEKPVEIHVARGVYKPDRGAGIEPGDRAATFRLLNAVAIMGGYAGLSEPDPNARDIELYETILSGDLNGDDVAVTDPCDLLHEPTRSDNAYVVVTASETDATTVLDGFTITAGQYMGTAFGGPAGGAGMHVSFGSPRVIDCHFIANSALQAGGGILNRSSSPTLIRCTFTGNSASSGGGMCNTPRFQSPQESNPMLIDCVFTDNYARSTGGGMESFEGSYELRNCTFRHNRALGSGGGICNSGSNLILTNCTFAGNAAGSGGGIHSGGNLVLTDCTFAGNTAGSGAGIHSGSGTSLILTRCTLRDNQGSGAGGAIYSESAKSIAATHCVFSGNSGEIGGGIRSRFSDVTLRDCTFERNVACEGYFGGRGGGLWLLGNGQIARCVFRFNEAFEGGALYNHQGGVTVTGCRFISNSAMTSGGAIYGYNTPSSFALGNCLFNGNSSVCGGAVFLARYSHLDMTACTFVDDIALAGNALACDPEATMASPGFVTLTNCILRDDNDGLFDPVPIASTLTITYSNVQSGWPGEGNIDVDPLFADPGYWDPNGTPDDPNDDFFIEGDYHLKSQAGRWDPISESWVRDDVTSPCIDTGDPMSPIGYEPFPNGGRVNMGAYGGTAEASKSYFGEPVCETIIAGDINGDCRVDFEDFAILVRHWLPEQEE